MASRRVRIWLDDVTWRLVTSRQWRRIRKRINQGQQ
jgi:hypothetical protein